MKCFVLSTDGKRGYFSSDKEEGYGTTDIYVMHFPDIAINLTVVKGIVVSIEPLGVDEKPLAATITLYDANNTLHGIYTTNRLTGKFILVVTPYTEYTAYIEAEGYILYTEKFSATTGKTEVKKIKLSKEEK